MKIGIRKPSPTRSLRARTTGRLTRASRRAINPWYGKKGAGIINDPRRAVKNAIYSRTTASVGSLITNKSNTKPIKDNQLSLNCESAYVQDKEEINTPQYGSAQENASYLPSLIFLGLGSSFLLLAVASFILIKYGVMVFALIFAVVFVTPSLISLTTIIKTNKEKGM